MAQDALAVTRRSYDIEDYIDIIRRHKAWIFAPTFAALVVAVVVAFLWPDSYLSTAVIRVVPPQVPETYIPPNINTDMQGRINSLTQLILNRSSLTQLVNKYQLYRKELLRMPMEDVIEHMKSHDIRIGPVQTFAQAVQGRQSVPAFMIGFQYNSRFVAQKVTNDLVVSFIENSASDAASASFETTRLLKKQFDDAKLKLDLCNQKLQAFRVKNLGRLPDQQQGNYSQMNSVQTLLINNEAAMSRLQQDRLTLENEMRIARQQLAQLKDPNTDQQVIDQKNEKLALKDKEIEQAETYLIRLRERYTEANPDVQSFTTQLASLKKQREQLAKEDQAKKPEVHVPVSSPNPQYVRERNAIQANIQRIEGFLQNKDLEMRDLQKQSKQLTESLRGYQSRIEGAPLGDREFSQLNSDREIALRQYQEAEQKLNMSERATEVVGLRQAEKLEILDPANPPQTSLTNRPLMIAAGTAIGLVLGLMLAGAREVKNSSLKNLKDVRAYTQLPVLGSIPLLENNLVVRRRRRLSWLAWSTACLVGIIIMSGSVAYYYNTRL